MQTATIRQIPNEFAENIGLDKYNKSRLPGTKERLQAALNTDGRFITGIDEESFLVPKEDKEKIKEIRLRLEKTTGNDLSGTSSFWTLFYVTISSDEDLVLNFNNAMHEISYNLLIANKYIAPDKDAISNPIYKDANYYAFKQEEEIKEEVSNRKLRDKAIGKLLTIETSKNKMALVGQYLEGLKYSDKLGEDTLYSYLRTYIEQPDVKYSKLFLEALEKPVEEIQRKLIIDKAFKARLIKSSKNGKKTLYQFGQVTLGSSVEEVYKNLSDVTFSNELMALQNELENK
jgi:hypothetical protein